MALLILFSLLILATILDDKNKPTPIPKTVAQQATAAKAAQAQYDACNVKLQKAKEVDMLYDMGGKGTHIEVFVDPTTLRCRLTPRRDLRNSSTVYWSRGAVAVSRSS